MANDDKIDRVELELARIAFSDMRKIVRWGPDIAKKETLDGIEGVPGVELLPSDTMDDATAASIQSISQTADGRITVKLHDKSSALINLGKHYGMWPSKIAAISTDDGEAVTQIERVIFVEKGRKKSED